VALPGTGGDAARRAAIEERPGLIERIAARAIAIIEPIVARVLGVPRIAMAHAVYLRYAASSGPVLARGLAFVALFALVPALLVILSIAGFFVADPAVRAEIAAILGDQFPPLAPLIDEALKSFSSFAPTTGIIGVALLVWSASGLVRALDGAFRVLFEDDGVGRTPIRDVVAVASVAGGTFAAALLLVVVTLPGLIGDRLGASPLATSIMSFLTITGLAGLAYEFVPRPRPPLRLLAVPAIMVGITIFLLTSLYAFLGPLLFGSAQLYGAFGALFLGLIWLGNVTELLLLGAAWVAERQQRLMADGSGEPPAAAPGT
jgi:YihY family inner membrane protein